MYTDKDKQGNISIMEITREETKNICSILYEFEAMLNKGASMLPEWQQGRLAMSSAKFRFSLIDALSK